MSDLVIKSPSGKPVFVGKEDPQNTISAPRNPNERWCNRCKKSAENEHAQCPTCGLTYDDSKMECPVCHHWFDYLVGSNDGGGIMGCEAHWKPPSRPVKEVYEKEVKDVFSE